MAATSTYPGIANDTAELRKPVLGSLCLAGVISGWLWVVVIGAFGDYPPPLRVFTPPVVLSALSTLCLIETTWSIKLRSAIFVVGLTLVFILGYLSAPSGTWLYYQALVVSISGLLAGPLVAVAAAIVLTVTAIAGVGAGLGISEIVALAPPLGLLWFTAIVTGLSAQNLYTALWWAMDSQARAWQTAVEVRERRAELRRTLDSLMTAHELLERTTRELDLARREAEQAKQAQSRFMANISHELRTPLNIIVGFAEMLCTAPEAYDTPTWSPALRGDLLTIWRNAEHLLGMIDDVLDLAQIEVSKLPILTEPTELTEFIRNTLTTAGALLRDSRLELRVSLPRERVLVELDRTRIRQVLLNLINNAVRHTPSGYIEVGAWHTDEDVTIYVRDTGVGIPEDKLEVIFQEFQRIATPHREDSGVGLGLAISKHFVQLHGGLIWAESTLGEGSTFYFTLARLRRPGGVGVHRLQRTRSADPGGEPNDSTVVVACHDPMVPRILARHMEDTDLVATVSFDQTIDAVWRQHPQAVLLAVSDGSTLPAAFREAQELVDAIAPYDVPVLVCSFPTERRAGMALGAADVLIKPVVRADVISAIERFCEAPRCALVVDDEPDLLSLLSRIVTQRWPGCRVLTASSGREAVTLARQRPDIILLDLLLPGLNGAQVLEALRATPQTADIPVIVVTARGPAEDVDAGQKGQVHLVTRRSLTAIELVRCLSAVVKSVPARYVNDTTPADTR
jgi:signal transduction histidine kinase/CheY-like chemotaxis protein